MNRRVLLIDDDISILRAGAAWLREAGYEPTVLSDFEQARTALDTTPFDALIAGVRLGAFNGIHLVMLAKYGNLESARS